MVRKSSSFGILRLLRVLQAFAVWPKGPLDYPPLKAYLRYFHSFERLSKLPRLYEATRMSSFDQNVHVFFVLGFSLIILSYKHTGIIPLLPTISSALSDKSLPDKMPFRNQALGLI